MGRRSHVGAIEICSLDSLATAFHCAARAKHDRPEVQAFTRNALNELSTLQRDMLAGNAPRGEWRSFRIFDPKPRNILAPCLHDRVVHHAMMANMGPIIDRSLIHHTYACREGRGVLAAATFAGTCVARFPWVVKSDIRAYFASIQHDVLLQQLSRRFTNPWTIELCKRVLERVPGTTREGLPIGALTSQYFANLYLNPVDRLVSGHPECLAYVRYMDDMIFFADSRDAARRLLAFQREAAGDLCRLETRQNAQVQRCTQGLSFLGFRIYSDRMWLSRRRTRLLARRRAAAEYKWSVGSWTSAQLQLYWDGLRGSVAHANATPWLKAHLAQHPPVDA
jgi:hypothetical protein